MNIYTNIPSLQANNNLKRAGKKGEQASLRLSSGLKINSAADDAAGLAISEKMRSQIRGLEKAERNVEDAKNLFMTGDGALNEINTMLIRARELAIQSANDTNTDNDRQKLDMEYQQLLKAIDGISDSTEFNTKKILKSGVKSLKSLLKDSAIA